MSPEWETVALITLPDDGTCRRKGQGQILPPSRRCANLRSSPRKLCRKNGNLAQMSQRLPTTYRGGCRTSGKHKHASFRTDASSLLGDRALHQQHRE